MNPTNLYPYLPFPLDVFLTFYTYIMILIIILLILKKIKSLGYQRTFVAWKDGTHSIKGYAIKEGRLQIRPKKLFKKKADQWIPNVHPENVIPAKKTLGERVIPFGFKQKDIVIAVEGSDSCLTVRGINIEDIGEKVVSKLLQTMSPQEIERFLNKTLALATAERKLFQDTQFYIFLAVMIAQLLLIFQIAQKIGVF